MTEDQYKAMINFIAEQRNRALDEIVMLKVQLFELQQKQAQAPKEQ